MFGINKVQLYIMRCLWEYGEIGFMESKPKPLSKALYDYHLSRLIDVGIIEKKNRKYILTSEGKRYVNGIFSGTNGIEIDIKILVHNKDGDNKIIGGRLLESDSRTHAAAIRIAQRKSNCHNPNLEHIGDAYIKILNHDGQVMEHTLSHIFDLKNELDLSGITERLPKIVKDEILFARNNADGHFFFERDYLME